jgi:hypothetical protein
MIISDNRRDMAVDMRHKPLCTKRILGNVNASNIRSFYTYHACMA